MFPDHRLNTPAAALATLPGEADKLLFVGRLEGEQRVGQEERATSRGGGHNQRACRNGDGLAAVDVAEGLAAGDVELEVGVALGDARHLRAQAVDAEDLADEVEVRRSGSRSPQDSGIPSSPSL